MAKIKHNDSFDIFKGIVNEAKSRGLAQLIDQSTTFKGDCYIINDQILKNFGYCGYLGLEMDERLKYGSIEMLMKNGMQYGVSRAYITSNAEAELLALLSRIFGNCKVIIQSSTSSAHIANLPNIVEGEDLIILDQQVHFSVQTGAQLCRQKGTAIEMIRHSNMEMLRRFLEEKSNKYHRIWYLIDGVYSMYGDTAPTEALKNMLFDFPKLHLYVDDAHGVSWYGEHGCGFAFSNLGKHPRIIHNTTMGKAFGVTGGISIYPDEAFYERVKLFGGPLTYSHPISPALLGASIESAKLHLSSQINQLQWELFYRIDYCNNLLNKTDLPILSDPRTPIFYVGLGSTKLVYNMVGRILNDGFYVNTALFPAVSEKAGGIRFSISRHNKIEEIEQLVDCINYHYPRALEEESWTDEKVRKAFKLPPKANNVKDIDFKTNNLHLIHHRKIQSGNKVWDDKVGANPMCKSDYLCLVQKAFSNNSSKWNNWDWHFIEVLDISKNVVFQCFFTHIIAKDDFIESAEISGVIEQVRKDNPLYLCSETLMMGTLVTEGKHYYLDETSDNAKEAIELMLQWVIDYCHKADIQRVIMRDFEEDFKFGNVFEKEGFIKIKLPNNNLIDVKGYPSIQDFVKALSKKKRGHYRVDVTRALDKYKIQFLSELPPDWMKFFKSSLEDVKSKNLAINYFSYPDQFFNKLNENNLVEFLVIKNKFTSEKACVIAALKWNTHYCPMFIGMNYNFLKEKIYKVALSQCVERAIFLKCEEVRMGYTADMEKRKLGAVQIPTFAYTMSFDNYSFEVISNMAKTPLSNER